MTSTAFSRRCRHNLRRSAITHALGAVSSYRTRLAQWEEGGRRGKSPVLGERTHAMPVFYRGNMYREAEGDQAFLKLYNGKDWVWVSASLLHTDMEYLRKHWTGVKASAPILEKRHRKYFLRFSFEEERKLTDRPVQEQRICAVDLGINTDAVCSIMEADGTVCARKFIDFADEKDSGSMPRGAMMSWRRRQRRPLWDSQRRTMRM